MSCSITELRNKEVICKLNGTRIGNVDDVEFDTQNGRLVSIVIYGRGKVMGLFGKSDDFVIPWESIDVIGEDTILVNCECPRQKKSHGLM